MRLDSLPPCLLWLALAAAATGCGDDDDTGPAGDGDADADVDGDADADVDGDADADADGDADGDADPPPRPPVPEVWLLLRHNLQVNENVATVTALLDRAAAAGYTGVVLADFKLGILHMGLVADWYDDNLAQVLAHAASLGLEVVPSIFPFGYSEAILIGDPNLAEGMAVLGAPFVVTDARTLALASSFEGLADGGFEAHTGDTFDQWSWQDAAGARTFADASVAHSGATSARIDAGADNARIVQALTLTPHRQYHLSFWLRTEDLSGGYLQVRILDAATGVARNFDEVAAAPTQDWTRYDVAFDSAESSDVNLYLGDWGGPAAGHLWFDDVSIEETALVNLIRRDGAPLVARDGGGRVLGEADIGDVRDPHVAASGFDDWHDPPVVALPAGSTLAPGDSLTMDFYVVAPVAGFQVGACLTEPAIADYMTDNLAAVAPLFPDASAFFLGYDEMRHMNTCAACAARGLDAGALLAAQVEQAVGVVAAGRPNARVWVWSDMFDPNHNAHADYYMVHGDLAGSWEGLPRSALVMNWNLGNTASLQFFAARGHAQVIAGYYDTGDGAASVTSELAAADGVDGIQGVMYTTWVDDFSQLEAYADGARAAW